MSSGAVGDSMGTTETADPVLLLLQLHDGCCRGARGTASVPRQLVWCVFLLFPLRRGMRDLGLGWEGRE